MYLKYICICNPLRHGWGRKGPFRRVPNTSAGRGKVERGTRGCGKGEGDKSGGTRGRRKGETHASGGTCECGKGEGTCAGHAGAGGGPGGKGTAPVPTREKDPVGKGILACLSDRSSCGLELSWDIGLHYIVLYVWSQDCKGVADRLICAANRSAAQLVL
jgi:hypothetical protein